MRFRGRHRHDVALNFSNHQRMNVTINGKPYELPAESTISSALEMLGFSGKPVVVEMNRLAIFPREYPTTLIPDQAVLEVIVLAAGG